MANKLRGAEAAARRIAEEEVARRDQVDQEIVGDLLLTPTHVNGPADPATAAYAYSDCEDGDEPVVELIVEGDWRRGPNGDLERIPAICLRKQVPTELQATRRGSLTDQRGFPVRRATLTVSATTLRGGTGYGA